MRYPESRARIGDIIEWLRGTDESEWESRTAMLSAVVAILRELSRPTPDLEKSLGRSPEPHSLPPVQAGIIDAMPYLRGMLTAMKVCKRKDALDYGEAALALLPKR